MKRRLAARPVADASRSRSTRCLAVSFLALASRASRPSRPPRSPARELDLLHVGQEGVLADLAEVLPHEILVGRILPGVVRARGLAHGLTQPLFASDGSAVSPNIFPAR